MNRTLTALLHDLLMAGISFPLALFLRYGSSFTHFAAPYLWVGTLLFTLTAASVFLLLRLQQGMWRYASLPDLIAITKAVSLAILLFYLGMFIATRLEGLPRSVPLIQWMILLAMLGGPRFLYRMLKEGSAPEGVRSLHAKVPVLLVGATDNAELFLRESQRNPASLYRVVGIVDDDKSREGRRIHNVTIHAGIDRLARIVEKLSLRGMKPQRLVLADERLEGERLQELLAMADKLGLTLARLPQMSEFKQGMQKKIEVRPVAVEDLLGRSQNTHDKKDMRALIEGKRVLVTGAGGTIGGELARQIASFAPAHLTVLDHSEFGLYQIDLDLTEQETQCKRSTVLCDIRDEGHMNRLFAEMKPELVFHAAAVKHVPIAEDNPEEAALTNVTGTKLLADACLAHGARAMVMISTDKAVNPSSVMGATKRLAESYIQALGASVQPTRFVAGRFGNVLGSTGSVVPLFRRQLEQGGPLTVTHKDMLRYFMTVREAVELVLQAASIGCGKSGAGAPIFVLDMGRPLRIEDLAIQMIRLAGLRPHQDIEIVYTGLRPGEKLFEELFHEKESLEKTRHGSIMRAHPREVTLDYLLPMLQELHDTATRRDSAKVKELLHKLVPEFKYLETQSAA